MEKDIIIKPKFELNEYFKANLYLAFSSSSYKILFAILTFAFFSTIIINFCVNTNTSLTFEYIYLFFFIYPIIIILSIYNRTKLSLKNKKLKESIIYKLNKISFEEIGETFNIKYNWEEIFKVKETNKWFIIYIQKRIAKIIIKKNLTTQETIDLKELFNSINIKKSLK